AGDQADLDAAIGGSERPSKLPTQQEIDAKFRKEGQGDSALKKIVDELDGINQKMEGVKLRIQNMQISAKTPALDFKALARALKIDKFPKADEKLEKALKLQGNARKTALEALQKDLGVTFSPQHMDSLLKAKVP
ncbi:MAG: hypothetical protein ABI651_08245, partial [Verrucomicrobiota bacterium]